MSVVSQARNALGRAKGYGGCYRCGGTWDYTEGHQTQFTESQACFPLCETCWVGLGTPEERMPYYRALLGAWLKDVPDNERAKQILEEWPLIEAAVEAGL